MSGVLDSPLPTASIILARAEYLGAVGAMPLASILTGMTEHTDPLALIVMTLAGGAHTPSLASIPCTTPANPVNVSYDPHRVDLPIR